MAFIVTTYIGHLFKLGNEVFPPDDIIYGIFAAEFMLSQLHDIYQTNPADLKRICLVISGFNTVNQ